MTWRVYTSTDSGVNQLTGEVGKLDDILNQILVTGTGLAQPAAGWTRPFNTTHVSVYTPGAGLGYSIHLDDNGPGAGTYKEARIYGAESFSALNTPTNQYPPTGTFANGLFVRKSATLDSTTRTWIAAADERTFYVFALTTDLAGAYCLVMGGEIFSEKGTTDLGRCGVIGRVTENSATMTDTVDASAAMAGIGTNLVGHYLARDDQNTVGSIAFGVQGDMGMNATGSTTVQVMVGSVAFPNRPDGNLKVAPLRVMQTAGGNYERGRLRGLWHLCHPTISVADRQTLSGTGGLAGRSFLVVKGTPTSGGVGGHWLLETSDTVDTNL